MYFHNKITLLETSYLLMTWEQQNANIVEKTKKIKA